MSAEIEAYVNGELQGDARRAFEQQLQLDPALRAEVAQQRQLMESLNYLKIRRHVQAAARENQQVERKGRWSAYVFFACAIGVLACVAWWFLRPTAPILEERTPSTIQLQPPSDSSGQAPTSGQQPPQLPATGGKPPIAEQPTKTPVEAERYRGDDDPEAIDSSYLGLFRSMLEQYPPALPQGGSYAKERQLIEKKDYPKALKLLGKREAKAAANDTLQYLTAAALLQSRQPVAASKRLFLLNSPGSTFQQEAQWLLGLGYLLEGKEDAARQVFEMIGKDRKHPRHEAALSLLDSLD